LERGVPDRALDLGTGSGIAAFLLARLGVHATGVDKNSDWQPLWRHSCGASDVTPTLRVADIMSGIQASWPLIVSNPPFFPAGTGPVSPNPWRASARTESTATLMDFVALARAALTPAGRACFVIPSDRVGDILDPTRVVRIGHRRALVEVHAPPRPCEESVHLGADASRVRQWYARVGVPAEPSTDPSEG
jgi:tRNA1(Val) A37 N6-methylase TrmN6